VKAAKRSYEEEYNQFLDEQGILEFKIQLDEFIEIGNRAGVNVLAEIRRGKKPAEIAETIRQRLERTKSE
jgi:hypothetical protein